MYPWTGRSGRSSRHGPIWPILCGNIWNRDVRVEEEGRLVKCQPSIEGMRTRTVRGPTDRTICAPYCRGDTCQSSSNVEDAPDHRSIEAPIADDWTCSSILSFGWRPVHNLKICERSFSGGKFFFLIRSMKLSITYLSWHTSFQRLAIYNPHPGRRDSPKRFRHRWRHRGHRSRRLQFHQ